MRLTRLSLSALVLAIALSGTAAPQEFTYQARITSPAGAPVTTANATITLDMYAASSGGTALATQTFTDLNLGSTGGYVNLPITNLPDLSGDVYVEVTVTDVGNAGSPETLTPRQKVTSVPFALRADKLDSRAIMVKPGEDVAAAYAKAKTMAPGYQNRAVVMLLPGVHVLNSTLVMDAAGVDLVGFGSKSATITGTANPLISGTNNSGTGATIRNLLIQATGASNRALDIVAGRVQDVIVSRSVGAPGTLIQISSTTNNVSIKDFEIVGDVNVVTYGAGTSFTNGYITGALTSTGSSTAQEMLVLVGVSGVGSVSFSPAGAFGILAFTNCASIGSCTYAANTVVQAGATAFGTIAAPAALPNPLAGSALINSIGDTSAWTGTTVSSGNLGAPSHFAAYVRK